MPSATLLYLFAITHQLDDKKVSTLQDAGFHLIKENDLQGIVKTVEAEVFDEEALAQNIKNMQWLQQKAIWHESQITQLLALTESLLPLKFGTIFESEKGVKNELSSQQEYLHKVLKQLEGCTEWALKIFVNYQILEDSLKQDEPQLKTFANEIAQAKPGKAYLMQKKYDKMSKEKAQSQLLIYLEDIYQNLAKTAKQSKLKPLNQQPDTPPEETFSLNAVFLLDIQQQNQWQNQIKKEQETYQQYGIRLQSSGPWAAYHFTQLIIPNK